MELLTAAGRYHRDEKCPIAHDFLESAHPVYLG